MVDLAAPPIVACIEQKAGRNGGSSIDASLADFARERLVMQGRWAARSMILNGETQRVWKMEVYPVAGCVSKQTTVPVTSRMIGHVTSKTREGSPMECPVIDLFGGMKTVYALCPNRTEITNVRFGDIKLLPK